VKIATKKLVDFTGLEAVIIYTEEEQFGQLVLAAVAAVHYIHLVRLFNMQQPHQCLLAVLVITGAHSSRYESKNVGLQKCRRERYCQENYFYIPYIHELTLKHSARLS